MKPVSSYILAVAIGIVSAPCCAQLSDLFDRTDAQREIEVGRRTALEVEKHYRVSQNSAMIERVKRIGSALVASLPQRIYPYEFKVLTNREFNAFCLPGGFMYVYEGLLDRLPDDNAVAFVMAHEIAHAARRHWKRSTESLQKSVIFELLTGFGTGLINLKYTREHEQEADKIGQEILWQAGYDLSGAINAAKSMEELEKGQRSIPDYLRTHPRATSRLKDLESRLPDYASRKRPEPTTSVRAQAEDLVGDLPDTRIAANKWYPLDAGWNWTYLVRTVDSSSSYSIRVTSAIKTASGTLYRFETTLPKSLKVFSQVLTSEFDVWRRSRPSNAASPWVMEFAFPPSGQQNLEREGYKAKLLPSEKVTTPCGEFADTLHLKISGRNGEYEVWFAQGVGLIKRTSASTGVTEILSSYSSPPVK